MISLWRDPEGEKVFTTNENTGNHVIGDKTKIAQLEEEILSLKQQLNNPRSTDNVRKMIKSIGTIIYTYVCMYSIQQETQN